jgi:hypothetical protein
MTEYSMALGVAAEPGAQAGVEQRETAVGTQL